MIVNAWTFYSLRQLQNLPRLPVIFRRVLLNLVARPIVHKTYLSPHNLQNVCILVKIHVFIDLLERAPQTLYAIRELQFGLSDLLVRHVSFLFFDKEQNPWFGILNAELIL